jgi:hypothetical protein
MNFWFKETHLSTLGRGFVHLSQSCIASSVLLQEYNIRRFAIVLEIGFSRRLPIL